MDIRTVNQRFEYQESRGIHVIHILDPDHEHGMIGSHWHEELEMVYTTSGHNRHFINGECFVTCPGQLLVVNSNFVHSIVPQTGDVPQGSVLRAIVLIISREFLEFHFPQYQEVYFTNEEKYAPERIDRIMMQLAACTDASCHADPAERMHRDAMILELISELYRYRTVPREIIDSIHSQQPVEKMKEVVTYIEDHYTERLTREMVAGEFYLSPNYFSSYFKKYVGMTFTQYLTAYRLGQGRDLLLRSDMSVGQIAAECGFSDDRSFITAFKTRFQSTPLQYRKKRGA